MEIPFRDSVCKDPKVMAKSMASYIHLEANVDNAQIERGIEVIKNADLISDDYIVSHALLKRVLLAMKDVHNKPCNNCGYIGCNQCEPAKETTVSAVPDDPLSRRITYFTIGGITYVPQTEQQRSLSVEEIVHIILLYTDKEKGHGMTDVAKTAIALHKRIYKE